MTFIPLEMMNYTKKNHWVSYTNKLPFFDLFSFCMFLDTTPEKLKHTLDRVGSMYSTFYIDKDTGRITSRHAGVRLREINAPREPLKSWQLKILEVLNLFPKHPANMAFIEGSSVLNAAKTAVNGDVLVHVDIKDFFPSHTALYIKRRLTALIESVTGVVLPEAVIMAMTEIMCLNMQLPQGSPCSPMATIVLNYDLDSRIDAVATKYNLQYKRYADDMWFTGTQPDEVIQEFLYDLQDAVHPFILNYRKTNIMRTRSYPKFKGIKCKLGDTYIPPSQSSAIIKIIVNYLHFTKHVASVSSTNITVEGIPIPQMPLDDVKQLVVNLEAEIKRRYPKLDIQIKPLWYYIQSTKKCLGLNIVDGEVIYPRKRYNDLRIEAMLLGRQRALFNLYYGVLKTLHSNSTFIKPRNTAPYLYAGLKRVGKKKFRNLLIRPFNRRVFMGKVAYLRSINPEKADKIMAIENASYKKCLQGYADWYPTVNIDRHPDIQWVNELVNDTTDDVLESLSTEELSSVLTHAEIEFWAV